MLYGLQIPQALLLELVLPLVGHKQPVRLLAFFH